MVPNLTQFLFRLSRVLSLWLLWLLHHCQDGVFNEAAIPGLVPRWDVQTLAALAWSSHQPVCHPGAGKMLHQPLAPLSPPAPSNTDTLPLAMLQLLHQGPSTAAALWRVTHSPPRKLPPLNVESSPPKVMALGSGSLLPLCNMIDAGL